MKDNFGYEANDNFVPRGPLVPVTMFSDGSPAVLSSEKVVHTKVADSSFVNLNYAIKNLRHNQNIKNKHGIAYTTLFGKDSKYRASAGSKILEIISAIKKWNDKLEPKYDAAIWVDPKHGRYTGGRHVVANRPLMTNLPSAAFFSTTDDSITMQEYMNKMNRKRNIRQVPRSIEVLKARNNPAPGSIYTKNSGVPGPKYDVEKIRYNKHIQRSAPKAVLSGWPEFGKEVRLDEYTESKENMTGNTDEYEDDVDNERNNNSNGNRNEEEDPGLDDGEEDYDEFIDELYYEENDDMSGHPIYHSVGRQVISKPLSGKGRTSPRAVFGTAPRFQREDKSKVERRKVEQLIVKKKFQNQKFFAHCYDESPGPRYLPVPTLWGIKSNVGAKSKPERMKKGIPFSKSPRFNL